MARNSRKCLPFFSGLYNIYFRSEVFISSLSHISNIADKAKKLMPYLDDVLKSDKIEDLSFILYYISMTTGKERKLNQ